MLFGWVDLVLSVISDIPKNGGEIDHTNIVYNDAIDNDEINDLQDEDTPHLNDGLADNNNNNNNIKHVGVISQQDKQQNHVGAPNNNLQPQNDHFGGMDGHVSDDEDKG